MIRVGGQETRGREPTGMGRKIGALLVFAETGNLFPKGTAAAAELAAKFLKFVF